MLSKILFATRDVDIRNIDEIDFITIVLYLIIATIVVVLLLSLKKILMIATSIKEIYDII